MTPERLDELERAMSTTALGMAWRRALTTTETDELIAEVRRCWTALYPHDFSMFDGGLGTTCRYCGQPHIYAQWNPKVYCAERHRQADAG